MQIHHWKAIYTYLKGLILILLCFRIYTYCHLIRTNTPASSEMTSNQQSNGNVETWSTKWSDFALVVKTGEELKCHKVVLAKASPYLEGMLSSDCEDTESDKIEAKEFSLETVSAFLEYIYADYERIPKQDVYKKLFDKTKITTQLMRMCHTYQVNSLLEKCSEHLMTVITENNLVSIWMEAERCDITDLKKTALDCIIKKKEQIGSLPGIEEVYKSPELVKSLVNFMARHVTLPPRFSFGAASTAQPSHSPIFAFGHTK